MSIRILPLAAILIAPAMALAADYDDPIDNMPVFGNRLPAIEKQLRELQQREFQQRLAEAERAKPEAATTVPAPKALSPFAPEINTMLQGDPADAYSACRDKLRERIEHLAAHTDNPSDVFLSCYMAIQAAEKLNDRGERSLAKLLYKDSIAALQALHQSAPDWNGAIVAHRIERAEEAIKALQAPK